MDPAKYKQRRFIGYARDFANTKGHHIWLGGSFQNGDPTEFSDVDIYALLDTDTLKEFIYGYARPLYISYTSNPYGIIIVIYEDGVAADIEVIEHIDVENKGFFHSDNIRDREYRRNISICRDIVTREDLPYHMSRLFHRSLIKFLSGKTDQGVSILNEIAFFMNEDIAVSESDYSNAVTGLIEKYHDQYPLDPEYKDLCIGLINRIKTSG